MRTLTLSNDRKGVVVASILAGEHELVRLEQKIRLLTAQLQALQRQIMLNPSEELQLRFLTLEAEINRLWQEYQDLIDRMSRGEHLPKRDDTRPQRPSRDETGGSTGGGSVYPTVSPDPSTDRVEADPRPRPLIPVTRGPSLSVEQADEIERGIEEVDRLDSMLDTAECAGVDCISRREAARELRDRLTALRALI